MWAKVEANANHILNIHILQKYKKNDKFLNWVEKKVTHRLFAKDSIAEDVISFHYTVLAFSVPASVSILASPISVVIVGLLIDKFGRKLTLLYCIAPSICGWWLLHLDSSIALLLLGQALNGLTINAGFYPVQVYAGECIMADNVRMRNIFMTWISLSTSFGTTLTLIMGNFFDYHEITLIFFAMSVSLLAVFFLIIPESPVWLYRKGRMGDAEWSQKRLGMTQSIFISSVKKQFQQPFIQDTSSFFQKVQKITRPDVYKPTIILSLTAILLSWCGTVTVITYMINVIQNTIPGVESNLPEMGNHTENDFISQVIRAKALDARAEMQISYQLSLYSGFFMCLGSIVSVFVLPRLGLKKMLIASKFCLIFALLTLTYGSEIEPDSHIRVVGVTIMTFLVGLEFGPRMSFAGDVFPVDAKGFASVPALAGSTSIALCNKFFPYLRVEFGGYAYCFYAAICLIGVIFIHFFVPEVVGRTLEDINKEYVDDIDK